MMHPEARLFSGWKPGLLLLAAGLLLPWLPLGDAACLVLRIATLTLVYMLLAQGLNVVTGFTGLLDFGYAGFMALGAYTAGFLTLYFRMSVWLVLPLAALHGALWGGLRGVSVIKLSRDYFAVATFAFAELLTLFIGSLTLRIEGSPGLAAIAPPDFMGRFFAQPRQAYYLVLVLLLGVTWTVFRLRCSRLGRAWSAIREDETAARCVGIDVVRCKLAAFSLSAAIGALAGAFYARWFGMAYPGMFGFRESILILCLVFAGGSGRVAGPLFGALCLIPLVGIMHLVLPAEWSLVRYLLPGLLLLVVMRWRPAGLLPAGDERG